MRGADAQKNSQLALYGVLLLGVMALMFSLRQCSTPPGGNLKTAKASGGDTIDVAISYSPMTLYRYADTLGGFCHDLLGLIAARDGFTFKYHPVTSASTALEGLGNGLYDMLVTDMARNSDAGEKFAFTSDVYLDKQVLVQRRDSTKSSGIASQLDLGGKEVWVEAESSGFWRLKHLAEEIGDTIVIKADPRYTSEQLLLMVAVGDVPRAVVNEHVALRLAGDYPLDISTAVSFTQFQAWMVRRDDSELLSRMNSALDSMKATDEYAELCSRYGLKIDN